jgi:hypothetical protein
MSLNAIDWQEAELPVLNEAQAAEWERAKGKSVTCHKGRWWYRGPVGLFQPIHKLARLSCGEATRPHPACIGFSAVLAEPDAAMANGAMPAHLLPDVQGYSRDRLSPRRRQQLAKAMREMDAVVVTDMDLIREQGYRIAREAAARNPGISVDAEEVFLRTMRASFDPPRGLIVAALRERQLLGFATGVAIDDAAYHGLVYVGEAGLPYHVSQYLLHVLASLAQRAPGVRFFMHGRHIPQQKGLCEFKRRQGIEVVRVPSRVWFAPGVEAAIKRLKPEQYYKFSGRIPAGFSV